MFINKISLALVFAGCCAVLTACNVNPARISPTDQVSSISNRAPLTAIQTFQAPTLAAAESRALDSDADRIVDSEDQCPGTPDGALVDYTGCELAMGVIRGLKFAPNEWILSPDAQAILMVWVDALLRKPELSIILEGHTDNRGKAADNLELSKKRVIAVVRFLVENGVKPDRIKPYGFGESRPIAANASTEGREINRRIEIKPLNP